MPNEALIAVTIPIVSQNFFLEIDGKWCPSCPASAAWTSRWRS